MNRRATRAAGRRNLIFGRGGGPGPRGGRGGGVPAPANRFDPADLERSLARMSVALTLDAAQQQAIREVMQEVGDRQRDRQARLDAICDAAARFDFSVGDAVARQDELMAGGGGDHRRIVSRQPADARVDLSVLSTEQVRTLIGLEAGGSPEGGRRRGRSGGGSVVR